MVISRINRRVVSRVFPLFLPLACGRVYVGFSPPLKRSSSFQEYSVVMFGTLEIQASSIKKHCWKDP
jgi:hypothetical protein